MGSRIAEHLRRRSTQSGTGMIEVLVAVVLASLTVAALAGALFAVVSTSAATADRQQLSATVSGYSESLKQVDWIPCGSGGSPTAVAYSDEEAASEAPFRAPVGVTLAVTRIEYWDAATASFSATCPTTGTRAQRLSVRATSGRGAVSGQIVKVPW